MDAWSAAARGLRAELGASSRRIVDSLAAAPRSAHFNGVHFRNSRPERAMRRWDMVRALPEYITADKTDKKPTRPVPLVTPTFPERPADLAATWLGHASVLIEIDGYRVLADPIFADRASPSQRVGPRRLHAAPISPADLPALDAIVISHDHYDHLDRGTIGALAAGSAAPFVVPLGVGAHVRSWGVSPDRVVELDWGGRHTVGELTLVCTPARHFSGRTATRNTTLWSSWAIVGPTRRVFFGGDTGYTAEFAEIGAVHGSFDVTVLPIGAYDQLWSEIHMNPEEALRAHRDLGGGALLPIHWATFDLARHGWSEPIERLVASAGGVAIATPVPGERMTFDRPPAPTRWWA